MVSDDNYFIGFPVLWNMVVYYLLFVLNCSALVNGLLVVFFAILHFVPVKFAYPSQASRLKIITLVATVIFLIALPLSVYFYPERLPILQILMVLNLVYFGGIAIYDTWIWKEK